MIQLVADWRPLWEWVEQGLRKVIARTNPTWVPADVYTELRGGTAYLATIADDAGFMVLKRLQDYDGAVLFVWALWGEDLAGRQDAIQADLEKLGREAGCKRIQMRSPRKGWGRVGWTERETVYERTIWAAEPMQTP